MIFTFDQSAELTPPLYDSNPGGIRRWWDRTKKYGTPAQLQSLRDRGYEIPADHTTFRAGVDGLANFGSDSESNSRSDFASEFGPEQAQKQLDEVNRKIAARAAEQARQQEQARQNQIISNEKSREAFRFFYATKERDRTDPPTGYASNRITIQDAWGWYASARGYSDHWSNRATSDRVNAELAEGSPFYVAWMPR